MENQVHRVYVGHTTKDGNVLRGVQNRIKNALNGAGIDGATILEAQGLWKGNSEASTVIELIGEPFVKVQSLAIDLKIELNQDAVYITRHQVNTFSV